MSVALPIPYVVLIFVTFSTAFWVMGSVAVSYNRRRMLLAQVASDYERARMVGWIAVLKPLLQDVAARLERNRLTSGWVRDNRDRYATLLTHAGQPGALTAEEFLAFKMLAPVTVFLVGFSVLQGDFLLLNVGAAAGGFLLPDNWLREKARSRIRDIEISLSDALDGFSLMMEAGLDLEQAIANYVDDPERTPLMEELSLMTAEVRLGKTRTQAMGDMAQKVNSAELSNLVTAVAQAEQTGVSLSGYLADQAQQLRARRFDAAEEQAQKAPIKMMAPLMLLVMPCVFLVLFGPMFIAYQAQ